MERLALERIDAARHTTKGTEMIACVAKRKPFCGFEKLKPVGFSVLREYTYPTDILLFT